MSCTPLCRITSLCCFRLTWRDVDKLISNAPLHSILCHYTAIQKLLQCFVLRMLPCCQRIMLVRVCCQLYTSQSDYSSWNKGCQWHPPERSDDLTLGHRWRLLQLLNCKDLRGAYEAEPTTCAIKRSDWFFKLSISNQFRSLFSKYCRRRL